MISDLLCYSSFGRKSDVIIIGVEKNLDLKGQIDSINLSELRLYNLCARAACSSFIIV